MEYDYNELAPSPMSDFLEYLISIKGRSSRTVHEYFLDLKTFHKFLCLRFRLVSKNTDFEEIDYFKIDITYIKKVTLLDLHAFISFIDKERNNTNRTKARKVACLKSFYRYLYNIVNIVDDNPAERLETPKGNKRLPIYLSLEESKALLDSIDGQNKERNFAIIMIFLNCGVRLSEIVSINISNYKEEILTVIGKGNKERTIYLNDSCKYSIEEYLKVRPVAIVGNEDAMFLSNRRTRISQRAIQHLVDKYLDAAGLANKHYSPHKLRHTAATLMYQYGNVDIVALQDILGHESVATTQIYTHINNKRLKDAIKSNPLSTFTTSKNKNEKEKKVIAKDNYNISEDDKN
ncbi:tyrosine recombinase XerC [Sedimentibacter sp. zth1]|uniref:tyrosine recombinase XerC n=1 Tax=Sedimentibacter sp. zth1 TaxID=2816908 RepID=UPI001A93266E|nr:tyrosine recombinase XerC [Sedimentibacter sp. zth1]QSX06515.1 tyrosine recombinase XerC [Sedimentibacter sp. zth1]